jgi:hypothetical protein
MRVFPVTADRTVFIRLRGAEGPGALQMLIKALMVCS